MKKLILLFALILNLSAFSQELKKDTTHKEIKIKKLEKSKSYTPNTYLFINTYGYSKTVQCKWVSSKGVRCKNSSTQGSCNWPNCASKK
jgi:hypothetical protein